MSSQLSEPNYKTVVHFLVRFTEAIHHSDLGVNFAQISTLIVQVHDLLREENMVYDFNIVLETLATKERNVIALVLSRVAMVGGVLRIQFRLEILKQEFTNAADSLSANLKKYLKDMPGIELVQGT